MAALGWRTRSQSNARLSSQPCISGSRRAAKTAVTSAQSGSLRAAASSCSDTSAGSSTYPLSAVVGDRPSALCARELRSSAARIWRAICGGGVGRWSSGPRSSGRSPLGFCCARLTPLSRSAAVRQQSKALRSRCRRNPTGLRTGVGVSCRRTHARISGALQPAEMTSRQTRATAAGEVPRSQGNSLINCRASGRVFGVRACLPSAGRSVVPSVTTGLSGVMPGALGAPGRLLGQDCGGVVHEHWVRRSQGTRGCQSTASPCARV